MTAMKRALPLLLATVAAGGCGICGIAIPCATTDNCPDGVCVDGACQTAEGEGEGQAGEGEGEGQAGEGEGEGEGQAGEGEGEGEGQPRDPACNGTVTLPAGLVVTATVSHNADTTVIGCYLSITAAFRAGETNIYVAPGIYDEANEVFPLTAPDGLSLTGDVASRGITTVISPQNPAPANTSVFNVGAGNFTARGIQFGRSGDQSARLLDITFSDAALIEDCTFAGTDTFVRAAPAFGNHVLRRVAFVGNNSIATGVFMNFSNNGSVAVLDSAFDRAGITIFGTSSAVTGFSMTNTSFTSSPSVEVRLDGALVADLDNVDFSLAAGETKCQNGLLVQTGTVKVRNSSFTGLACDFNGTSDPHGAVNIAPALGESAPVVDLGASAVPDPGANTFSNNLLDVSVLASAATVDLDVPALGNAWSDSANPCAKMRVVTAAGHTATVRTDVTTCQ